MASSIWVLRYEINRLGSSGHSPGLGLKMGPDIGSTLRFFQSDLAGIRKLGGADFIPR